MQPERVAREVANWLGGRIPAGWFAAPPEVLVDGEEILVVGTLPDDPATDPEEAAVRFREETREQRIRLATELQRRWRRKVSWGVACGGERLLFTTLSVPVMTRLRMPERRVLDTLIDAGVARSRSDALAWCVRLVGRHQSDWIRELQDALVAVRRVRAQGPDA
ncbi:MAG TPA: hypothetical protein VFD04_04055 [Actinomycetes bacterium]|jgi:hypothetical protein|nr:hypothetical protein [Actinomycetes bacterium]